MSISNPKNVNRNPSKRFFQWKGSDEQGYFQYYDKSIEDESERNIRYDFPEGFIIIDKDLFSITGYDESTKGNVISNEVRELQDELIIRLYVKNKNPQILLRGSYEALKETIKNDNRMKYTKSVYVMDIANESLDHINLSGGAFAAWLEHVESNANHPSCVIHVTGFKDGKKGSVKFRTPVFEVGEKITPELFKKACEIDGEVLQPYLEGYLKKSGAKKDDTSQEEPSFDPKNWREFKTSDGRQLCNIDQDGIRHIYDELCNSGDVDSPIFNCVNQALMEYAEASKNWESKNDKSGKPLKDYSLEEITEVLDRVPCSNPVHIYLQVAHDAIKQASEVVEPEILSDDDDIPF